MRRTTIQLLLILALWSLAHWTLPDAAGAQFVQYTPPGRFEEERESMEGLLDRSMKDARWRWGRLFIHPWVGISDLSYIDDDGGPPGGENSESDYTATVGAGVRAYLPLRNATLALHVLPEYVWWKDSDDRRRLNGRYGAGLFTNLGRTGLEVSATRIQSAPFVSRELQQKITTRDDEGEVAVEVDVGRGVALFGGGSVRRVRFLRASDDPERVDELERDEEVARAGVRFQLPRSLTIGLGVESSTVDFVRSETRSNSGTSPILQIDFDALPISFSAHLAWRDLEAETGSSFVPYDAVTGSARLAWRTTGRLDVQLFADRNLVYSASQEWAYYEDTTVGAGIRFGLSSRTSLRLFADRGRDEYSAFAASPVERRDDFDSFGGDFLFRMGRFSVNLGATKTDYDSNLEDFDRSITVIHSGLNMAIGGSSPWG